jgi:hypothetical protein
VFELKKKRWVAASPMLVRADISSRYRLCRFSWLNDDKNPVLISIRSGAPVPYRMAMEPIPLLRGCGVVNFV